MNKQIEAMKLALEALEKLVRFESDSWELGSCRIAGKATKALREALAEQPRAEGTLAQPDHMRDATKMVEQPAQQPLTEEQLLEALVAVDPETKRLPPGFRAFARAIEAKLKEKNT